MSPEIVVIGNVSSHNSKKMLLTKNDHMVETFPPNGTDHSFAIRILPGRMWSNRHLFDAHHLGFPSEAISVDLIPVADQKTRFITVPWKCLHDLPCRPFIRRVTGRVEVDYPPAAMGKDDKTVQELEGRCRDDEEITGGRHVHMVLQESTPRLRWRLSDTRHVLGDGGLRYIVAEFKEFTMDSGGSPEFVVGCHFANECLDFGLYRWPTLPSFPALPCPENSESLPVPANDGIGLHDDE